MDSDTEEDSDDFGFSSVQEEVQAERLRKYQNKLLQIRAEYDALVENASSYPQGKLIGAIGNITETIHILDFLDIPDREEKLNELAILKLQFEDYLSNEEEVKEEIITNPEIKEVPKTPIYPFVLAVGQFIKHTSTLFHIQFKDEIIPIRRVRLNIPISKESNVIFGRCMNGYFLPIRKTIVQGALQYGAFQTELKEGTHLYPQGIEKDFNRYQLSTIDKLFVVKDKILYYSYENQNYPISIEGKSDLVTIT